MLVPMTKVRLLGARRDVQRVVDELHQLGLVEIADARASLAVGGLAGDEDRSKRREELRRVARRMNALEHVVVPRLESERAHIALVLEEREMEDRVRLRRMRSRGARRGGRR